MLDQFRLYLNEWRHAAQLLKYRFVIIMRTHIVLNNRYVCFPMFHGIYSKNLQDSYTRDFDRRNLFHIHFAIGLNIT